MWRLPKKSITENNIKSFCRHWIHVPTSTCVRHCNVKKYISYWMFHDFIVLYVILYRIALCSTFSVFYIRTQSVHTVHSEHTHLASTIKIYLRSNCVDSVYSVYSVYVCINIVSMLGFIQSSNQQASRQRSNIAILSLTHTITRSFSVAHPFVLLFTILSLRWLSIYWLGLGCLRGTTVIKKDLNS